MKKMENKDPPVQAYTQPIILNAFSIECGQAQAQMFCKYSENNFKRKCLKTQNGEGKQNASDQSSSLNDNILCNIEYRKETPIE